MKSFRRSRDDPTRCRKRRTPPTCSQAKPGPRLRIEPASRTALSAAFLLRVIFSENRCLSFQDHALGQIASRIRHDHGAYGLVIFDVTGAAAQMTVERFGNRFLKIGARDRLLRQTLEQNLALVEEAGRTVAALKGEVL